MITLTAFEQNLVCHILTKFDTHVYILPSSKSLMGLLNFSCYFFRHTYEVWGGVLLLVFHNDGLMQHCDFSSVLTMEIHVQLALSHDTQIVILMFVDYMRRIFRVEELIFLRFWQAIMRLICINSHSVPCCLHPIIVTNLHYLQTDLTGHLSEIFAVVLQFQAPQYYEDIKGRWSGGCHEMHWLFFFRNINLSLHFKLFLLSKMAQVVGILLHWRQRPT